MSRLDYKRKKQKKQEALARPENAFVSFLRSHTGLIALISILLIIVIAALIIGSNSEFREKLFSNEQSLLYLDENTVFEMVYTEQEKSVIKTMGSNAIICSKEKISLLSESGHISWEIPIVVNEPVLSIGGDYILVCDRGGKDIYLINGGKIILQTASQYNIINAKVCSDGKFVIISEEPHYKAQVSVKDAKNNEIFVWHSGSAYIIDTVIGEDKNKLALATINATSADENKEENGILSSILMFNLYEAEPYKTYTFKDCIITNVYKADRGFMAVTDKQVVSFDAQGEQRGEFIYGQKNVNKIYKSDSLLMLSFEDESGKSSITTLDNSSKEKCSINLRQEPSFISADADRLAYGGGGDIVISDSAGKELYHIQTSKKYNSLLLFDAAKRAVGMTGTTIDIIEIK